ncbi:MAG: SDR family oxidoreductase [Phycisphaerae bacterium]|nr:SDR family oxidoreductase [Phycisphaerae bacterium]
MSEPLKNRIAVVTGASAGIGQAIARALAAQGARVVVNARRQEPLGALVREIGAARATAVAGDASDPTVITRMLDEARARFGDEADLVVVNAGRGLNGSVLTSDTRQWEEMVRTNLLGAAHLIRQAAGRMAAMVPPDQTHLRGAWLARARDIVVIGSVVGRNVSPFSSMYGSTKFAVHGLVEGARRELSPRGVRVTLVEPGFVVSEFQEVAGYDAGWFQGVLEKIGPALTPDDVARAVAFIAQQSAHVHVADVLIRPTRQDYP